jgi:aldose 1-epimerase
VTRVAVALTDGFQTQTLGSPQLQATFVPGAGMLCSSLRHEGEELLAQRDGVRAYAERGTTMGIPLLYPWANRLAGDRYPGPHGDVVLAADDPLLKFDANRLPIHGVLPRGLEWELLSTDAGSGEGDGHAGASDALRARLRWDRPELLAIFPFAHVLELRASIAGATLTVETSVATPDDPLAPVPVSFGFHPYLTIPGCDRAAWEVELPVSERLLLDEQMIPTGEREPFDRRRFALADSDWDDAFVGLIEPSIFSVSGAGRRIELQFLDGYSYAQVYAPAAQGFICFEPMTAPTNALRSHDGLRSVEPGGLFRAAFRISIR